MTRLLLPALVCIMLSPCVAQAQDAKAPPAGSAAAANCPAMMSGMEKQLDGMMGDVNGMMGAAKDPAMKQRLSNMHDRMALMMANMQQMHGPGGGMMGGGMSGGMKGRGTMGGGMMQSAPAPAKPQAPSAGQNNRTGQ